MTVKIHVLDAYGEIPEAVRHSIQRELDDALAVVISRLTVDRVDVVVGASASQWVIPEYGLGGRTETNGRVVITIDPASPRLGDPDRAMRLRGLLAHELHHVVRGRGPGYGNALGETLVSEGLAQCFEEEAGAPTPFYAIFLDRAALARVEARAKEAAGSRHDNDAWYFGRRDDPDWPRYAGYALGYAMVKGWLDANATNAASSATLPANAIIDAWRNGRFDIRYPTL